MAHISIIPTDRDALEPSAKEDWIQRAKRILIQIQLRDNLEKTLVLRDYTGKSERRILMKPEERQFGSWRNFEGRFFSFKPIYNVL